MDFYRRGANRYLAFPDISARVVPAFGSAAHVASKRRIKYLGCLLLTAFALLSFAFLHATPVYACDAGTASSSNCIVILTSSAGAGNQTWTVPADFSFTNQVACIGSGGEGAANYYSGGGGGGGGAYAFTTNLSLSGTITYAIGESATTSSPGLADENLYETFFKGTASSTASLTCDWGKAADTSGDAGAGGTTTQSIGTEKYAGGTGGLGNEADESNGGGGGGGSAGPNGAGQNGGTDFTNYYSAGGGGGGSNGGSSSAGQNSEEYGATDLDNSGGDGGSGTSGSGGGGGGYYYYGDNLAPGQNGTVGGGGGGGGYDDDDNAQTTQGGNGGCDTTLAGATVGACGGGGGGGSNAYTVDGPGGNGGTYGGGGGGSGGYDESDEPGGAGGQGIIVIMYTPLISYPARPSMIEIWGGFFRQQGGSVEIR